jgi:hypothetical protein
VEFPFFEAGIGVGFFLVALVEKLAHRIYNHRQSLDQKAKTSSKSPKRPVENGSAHAYKFKETSVLDENENNSGEEGGESESEDATKTKSLKCERNVKNNLSKSEAHSSMEISNYCDCCVPMKMYTDATKNSTNITPMCERCHCPIINGNTEYATNSDAGSDPDIQKTVVVPNGQAGGVIAKSAEECIENKMFFIVETGRDTNMTASPFTSKMASIHAMQATMCSDNAERAAKALKTNLDNEKRTSSVFPKDAADILSALDETLSNMSGEEREEEEKEGRESNISAKHDAAISAKDAAACDYTLSDIDSVTGVPSSRETTFSDATSASKAHRDVTPRDATLVTDDVTYDFVESDATSTTKAHRDITPKDATLAKGDVTCDIVESDATSTTNAHCDVTKSDENSATKTVILDTKNSSVTSVTVSDTSHNNVGHTASNDGAENVGKPLDWLDKHSTKPEQSKDVCVPQQNGGVHNGALRLSQRKHRKEKGEETKHVSFSEDVLLVPAAAQGRFDDDDKTDVTEPLNDAVVSNCTSDGNTAKKAAAESAESEKNPEDHHHHYLHHHHASGRLWEDWVIWSRQLMWIPPPPPHPSLSLSLATLEEGKNTLSG